MFRSCYRVQGEFGIRSCATRYINLLLSIGLDRLEDFSACPFLYGPTWTPALYLGYRVSVPSPPVPGLSKPKILNARMLNCDFAASKHASSNQVLQDSISLVSPNDQPRLPHFLLDLHFDLRLSLIRVDPQSLHMHVRDLLPSPGFPLLLGFLDPCVLHCRLTRRFMVHLS